MRKKSKHDRSIRFQVEALEDRFLPSTNSISGFVYQDGNNNGIFDGGESPIANTEIKLKNSGGAVIGTTTTDGSGKYTFAVPFSDGTSVPQTVTFDERRTNFDVANTVDAQHPALNKFNPALGTLTSVEILHQGTISSQIQVENTSPDSAATITPTVSGQLVLIAPGVTTAKGTLTATALGGSFNAAAFDGNIDFTGPSGTTFPTPPATKITASNSKTVTLSTANGDDLSAYIGNGTLSIREQATATSHADGGGNLVVHINSWGSSTITVIYHYTPAPSTYTVVETQPTDFLDGKDKAGSLGGDATSVNDQISGIPLGPTVPSTDNNFGELNPASISGYVYHDHNNDGIMDPLEEGLTTTLTLTGKDDKNVNVTKTVSSDGSGYYEFLNLRPGTYTVKETQVAGYNDGKDTAGSKGGNTSINDQIANFPIGIGEQSTDNNFGEIKTTSISGHVYVDGNDNGIFDFGEQPIPGIKVTLTGNETGGPAINKTATTNALGYYEFLGLKPGVYNVTEGLTPGYIDGQDAVGSVGGTLGNDTVTGIALLSDDTGTDYDFGELLAGKISGYVYIDANKNGVKDPGEQGINGTTVTLNGADDIGFVNATAVTNASGFYQFIGLRPGSYALLETQPNGYNDGAESLGTLNGTIPANDNFGDITVNWGDVGTDYNFGEYLPEVGDVGIVKTASPSSVKAGSNVSFTLTVTNYGPYTAKNLVVTDTMPASVTYVSASGSGWTFTRTGQIITATRSSLAANQSSQLFITVKTSLVSGTLINYTQVTTTTPDNNLSNNKSNAPFTVTSDAGQPFTKTIVPLVTALGQPIVSKAQLMSFSNKAFVVRNMNMTYVDGVIRSLTGAVPTSDTVNNYATQLNNGRSRDSLVAEIWNTTAHRALQADNFYLTFYHRKPTTAERNATITQLKAGVTEANLAVKFLASTEYQQLHPTSTMLVAGFNQDILGRLPSTVQQQAMLQSLANQSVFQVAEATVYSSDAAKSVIDDAYRAALRRPATPAEIQAYLPRLVNRSLTYGGLVQSLLSSNDFYQLAWGSKI